MNIAISYRKRERLHYLLRVVPRSALTWNPGANCLAHLDGLLSSKMPSQLLQAIDGAPSLYPDGVFGGRRYWCELKDAPGRLSDFRECDEVQLEAELQIVSVKELRANNTRLTQLIAEYGTGGPEYAAGLKYLNGKECVLLVERLQDWMTLPVKWSFVFFCGFRTAFQIFHIRIGYNFQLTPIQIDTRFPLV